MNGMLKCFSVGLLGLFVASSSAWAGPTVSVIETGTGAKAPLQFVIEAGDVQPVKLTWEMSMNMNMGGLDVPMEVPPVNMTLQSKTSVSKEDRFEYDMKLTKLTMAPSSSGNPMVEAMRTEMEKLVGMSSHSQMKPSGEVVSSSIQSTGTASKDLADQLTSAMTQSLVVFPADAIGVGAKWKVTDAVDERGMKLERTTTVVLKERAGTRVLLQLSISAKPLSSTITSSDLPPGSTATLKSFDMSGSGMVLYDLKHLFPVESDVKVNANTVMEVSAEGQTMEVGNGLSFKVKIRSE